MRLTLSCRKGYMNSRLARLVLEDGRVFCGKTFALAGDKYAEIVFNTGMTGYQEILTDPSYKGQAVVMTYPLIGNYGINDDDDESRKIFLEALLVREYTEAPRNWRSKRSLKDYLESHNIMGVEGLDTRAITKHIRKTGTCKGAVTTSDESVETIVRKLKNSSIISGFNLAKEASCERSYHYEVPNQVKYRVAVLDCGVKYNILRHRKNLGCALSVFNVSTHYEKILEEDFDGIFISNGPGDPSPVYEVVNLVKHLLGKKPIFGICMGHQILGHALGVNTYKLPFGHHGINHPIKNLETGQVEITSQNHNYALDPETLSQDVKVTHINLNDQTIAGIYHPRYKAFSVQYHPEAAPGPSDSHYLFKRFVHLMDEGMTKKFPNPSRQWHESSLLSL